MKALLGELLTVDRVQRSLPTLLADHRLWWLKLTHGCMQEATFHGQFRSRIFIVWRSHSVDVITSVGVVMSPVVDDIT